MDEMQFFLKTIEKCHFGGFQCLEVMGEKKTKKSQTHKCHIHCVAKHIKV
jgi:hypothetical protein